MKYTLLLLCAGLFVLANAQDCSNEGGRVSFKLLWIRKYFFQTILLKVIHISNKLLIKNVLIFSVEKIDSAVGVSDAMREKEDAKDNVNERDNE